VKIRLAQDADGPRIGELARASGFGVEGIDWSEVHPFWLVAEDEKIVGALQIILAKPIGWLEMLVLDPDLTQLARARVVKRLASAGMTALKRFGAQIVMFSVPFEEKAYKKALKKRGAVVTSSGNVLAKRL
jgi:hypothetical protein